MNIIKSYKKKGRGPSIQLFVEDYKESDFQTLFYELRQMAEERRLPMVKTPSAFGRRLRDLEMVLAGISILSFPSARRWCMNGS